MALIPKQVKITREAITVKLPLQVVESLRLYAEFLDSTQEYVVSEVLSLTFQRDKDFQKWLVGRNGGGR